MLLDRAPRPSYQALALELIKHREELLRRARICVGRDDAEDLIQSTLEKALANLGSFQSGTNMFAWLRRIMSNLMVDEWRRRRRWGALDLELVDLVSPAVEPTEEWESLSDSDVAQAVPRLPDHLRSVFELAHRGYSYQQIADTLSLHIRTVGTRLLRARRQLRRYLIAELEHRDERPGNVSRIERADQKRPRRRQTPEVASSRGGAAGHNRHVVSAGTGCQKRQQRRYVVDPIVHGARAGRTDSAVSP
jgi:RNA polymerase sigma-70 factor (ECF subfamily)